MAGLRKVWKTNSIAINKKNNNEFYPQKYDDGMI
jgi:hypothetical protein